jgi:hypothetical protein
MNGLAQNPVAHLGANSVLHHQVHGAAEDGFEVGLDADELEDPHGQGELDQHVHVAPLLRFSARHGPEYGQGAHAKQRDLLSMRLQNPPDVFDLHVQPPVPQSSANAPRTQQRRATGFRSCIATLA